MVEKRRLLAPDLVASRMGKGEHAWVLDFGFHRGRINRPPAHATRSSCSPAYGGNARGWKQPALRQPDTDLPPQLIVGRRNRLDASPRAIRSATGEFAALDCCSEDGLVWHLGILDTHASDGTPCVSESGGSSQMPQVLAPRCAIGREPAAGTFSVGPRPPLPSWTLVQCSTPEGWADSHRGHGRFGRGWPCQATWAGSPLDPIPEGNQPFLAPSHCQRGPSGTLALGSLSAQQM
jgi:hypothetical protein